MNGQPRDLLSNRKMLLAGVGAVGMVTLSLGGCSTYEAAKAPFRTVPINETSPAAEQIKTVLAKPGDYPTFAGIPAVPTDLPTADAFKTEIRDQQAAGAALLRDTAPETWTLDASDAFAARAQSDAGAGDIHPPTDAEIAESEAFAKAMRDRARPPSRPK